MIFLPPSLGHLTLAELERQFAGSKVGLAEDSRTAPKHRIEVNTKLAEVTIPIQGCEGANFFEHVVAGVTVFTPEST